MLSWIRDFVIDQCISYVKTAILAKLFPIITVPTLGFL